MRDADMYGIYKRDPIFDIIEERDQLKATITQKDVEIERLREGLREIAEFDADKYIRYETAIKFMKDMARLAWMELEVTND